MPVNDLPQQLALIVREQMIVEKCVKNLTSVVICLTCISVGRSLAVHERESYRFEQCFKQCLFCESWVLRGLHVWILLLPDHRLSVNSFSSI